MDGQSGGFFQLTEIEQQRLLTGKRYFEFLRVPALSAGLYVLPTGGADPQSPPRQDAVYHVIRAGPRMRMGTEDQEARAGRTIYVAARAAHRFYELKEHIAAPASFAPAAPR